MKLETLHKYFSACEIIVPSGQFTVTDKVVTMLHSDTGGVSIGKVICKDFTVPDGVYGLEAGRLVNLLGVIKSKEVELELSKDKIIIKFEKTKKSFSPLALATLPKIRPNVFEKAQFPCKIEVDKAEFADIVNIIDKTTGVEQNGSIKVSMHYDGKCLSIKTEDDPRDFIERAFEITSVELGKGEQFISFYPFAYLKDFAKIFKKINSDIITVSFGNETPLVALIKDDDVDVSYMLAQMIGDKTND